MSGRDAVARLGAATFLTIYGGVVLTIAATAILTGFWMVAHPGARLLAPGIPWWQAVLLVLAIALGLSLIHELLHGAAMLAFGARPRFGMAVDGGLPGTLYCTARDHPFARRQFLVVSLLPAVAITAAGVPLVFLTGWGGWLIVPLALHAGGCAGDLFVALLVSRLPPDSFVAESEDGLVLVEV